MTSAAFLKEMYKNRYSRGELSQSTKQKITEKDVLKFSIFVTLHSKSFPVQANAKVHGEMKGGIQEQVLYYTIFSCLHVLHCAQMNTALVLQNLTPESCSEFVSFLSRSGNSSDGASVPPFSICSSLRCRDLH